MGLPKQGTSDDKVGVLACEHVNVFAPAQASLYKEHPLLNKYATNTQRE